MTGLAIISRWSMPNGILSSLRPTILKITRQEWLDERISKGMPKEAALDAWDKLAASEFYENDIYFVQVDKKPPHEFKNGVVWALWISRHDNDSIRDWRDLQFIKNCLVGREVEAVELYPSEDRLCDAANKTALFCFMSLGNAQSPRFPVGYNMRIVANESISSMYGQRPLVTNGNQSKEVIQ